MRAGSYIIIINMSKKQLHYYSRRVHVINPWIILILCLISGSISVYSLRQNNLKMVILRDKVIRADEQNGNTELEMRNLRQFVYKHMNTNLASGSSPIKPPLQLKNEYDRLVAAQKLRLAEEKTRLSTEALAKCQYLPGETFAGGPRIPCIQSYIADHSSSSMPIDSSLYKFDFLSPAWSPDLAGWSLLIAVMLFIVFIIRLALYRLLKSELEAA